ncbi:hypothetical protein [Streptomyces sp. 1222.5]|uniref:hypothetical protein n=1 Tax=Streptomyces sp. 1222.5 TaxID=1881026 RepID=UPI003EB72BC2
MSYDRGYWQNLTAYNFTDQTSSYWTGACSAHLAENINPVGRQKTRVGSLAAGSGCPAHGTPSRYRTSSGA